ncbi:MAG TPA: MFS transporter [Solirubrobacteraceae bacterium]|nr:MFS transporter [Solirubrobacteraceae bacterium]
MSNSRRAASASVRGVDWFWRLVRGHVVEAVGGPARTRVVVLFGCVLALSSAQISTVGAVAPTMEHSLHIHNTEIGLLNTVTLLVAAFAVLPIGLLVDKTKRIPMLSISIVLWSVTTMLGALAGSYGTLLLSRVLLGLVSATAGPAIASLTGDYFPSYERARVYGYILTGEIAGTAVGFVLCGSIASALSWQAAFWLLAIPGLFLARSLWRTVPEPMRGGQSRLERGAAELGSSRSRSRGGEQADGKVVGEEQDQALRMAQEQGYKANPRLILYRNPDRMSLADSIRYIMRIPTNVMLIISSSLGYFFLSGLETFAVVFVRGHWQISQADATLFLGVLVIGAVVGTLLSGPLTDLLTRMGHLAARIWVPAICNVAAGLVLIPGILAGSLVAALPFCFAGTALISAANPPLDAARLDIMPPKLWGRAESVRTFLRSVAQALAPLLFGGVSDLIAGFEPQKAPLGTHTTTIVSSATGSGLEITFLVMLASLLAAGWFLWRARETYAVDVVTAGASWSHSPGGSDADGGAPAAPEPPPSAGPQAPTAPAGGGARAPIVDLSEADTRVARRPAPDVQPREAPVTPVAPASESLPGGGAGGPQRVPEYDYRASRRTPAAGEDETRRVERGAEEETQRIELGSEDETRRVEVGSEEATQRIRLDSEDETRRVERGSEDETRRVERGSEDETRRVERGSEDATRRIGQDEEDATQRIARIDEDATEPLVRRRRPAPEWLRDRGGDETAGEPLVWPREPPPDD